MKLQEWINGNLPAENLIYGRAGVDQAIWVRDALAYVIFNSLQKRFPEIEDWRTTLTVEGEHTSKSVPLPVYKFVAGDIKIKIRGNFHDWCVRYWGPEIKDFPVWMGVHDMQGFYEGMTSDNSPLKFCVGEREKLYAILWWMLREGLDD